MIAEILVGLMLFGIVGVVLFGAAISVRAENKAKDQCQIEA